MDSENLLKKDEQSPEAPQPADTSKEIPQDIIPDEVPRKDGPGGEGN